MSRKGGASPDDTMPDQPSLQSKENCDRIRDVVAGIGQQLRSLYEVRQPATKQFNELLDKLDDLQDNRGTKQSSRDGDRQPA